MATGSVKPTSEPQEGLCHSSVPCLREERAELGLMQGALLSAHLAGPCRRMQASHQPHQISRTFQRTPQPAPSIVADHGMKEAVAVAVPDFQLELRICSKSGV